MEIQGRIEEGVARRMYGAFKGIGVSNLGWIIGEREEYLILTLIAQLISLAYKVYMSNAVATYYANKLAIINSYM